jgi:adenine-specific DNA-methyltransferase
VLASQALVADVLVNDGWDRDESGRFAEKVVSQDDYLLRGREQDAADFVLGNPPYIRLEDLPPAITAAYRRACPTMGGRADVYVGFLEVGLSSLKPDGVLGFIVADRWMHNAYGARLRKLVTSRFSVDVTIQMHDVDAFDEQVSAYPAVSILRRGKQRKSVIADTTSRFGPHDAEALGKWVSSSRRKAVSNGSYEVDTLPHWFSGDALWPSGNPATIRLMEDLNDRFHPLEDPATNTRVGIGVATGADQVYVTKDAEAVEPERMLPLSMVIDTNSGKLKWSGHYLVNPWDEGKLVELEDWPRLAKYLKAHGGSLRERHIAEKNAHYWYRTIDKVTASLTDRPKLLFPDMRMTSRPVYDPGGLYPHHNLYFVVSDTWDLKVLGGLLFSRIVEATVEAYCVKMRGGTMRFQAQYLRQIRVPRPEDISESDAEALVQAFERRDAAEATVAALRVYGLDDVSWLMQRGIG